MMRGELELGEYRRWTQEEIVFLKENVGWFKVPSIAEKLQRTVSAVQCKMFKLGIDATKLQTGKITAFELAKTIQIDNRAVYRWIKRDGLKAVKRATRNSAQFYFIDIDDFWEWASENKEKLNFSKIDPLALLPEPDWVAEERKKDYQNIPERFRMKWSEKEEKRVVEMVKSGYSYEEIGRVLQRKASSVKRKVDDLKDKGFLPKTDIKLRWTEQELTILYELEAKGLTDKEIAWELGREAHHIRWKRQSLRREGKYQGRKNRIS